MEKLGRLTPENIFKTIESLTFLQTQLNGIPEELKGKILEIAQKQAETLILTLLRLLLMFKDGKSGLGVTDAADDALLSSHKAINKLIREKMEAYLDERKRDADIGFYGQLRDIYDKVGTD